MLENPRVQAQAIFLLAQVGIFSCMGGAAGSRLPAATAIGTVPKATLALAGQEKKEWGDAAVDNVSV